MNTRRLVGLGLGLIAGCIVLLALRFTNSGSLDNATDRNPAVEARMETATIALYVLWLEPGYTENRLSIDTFLRCLLDSSNLEEYWNHRVTIVHQGSWLLPGVPEGTEWQATAPWIEAGIESGRLPRAPEESIPVYLVLGSEPHLQIRACGRNSVDEVGTVFSGLAVVRNHPLCWPTGDRLRTETQGIVHELVETIDRILGLGSCAGGGRCAGDAVCTNHCDTFVGLYCEGAPEITWTGCGGGSVQGWLVQKFSHEGRAACGRCTECDFTPTIRGY